MSAFAIVPVWGWLALSAVFFAGGEFLSKKFALSPSPQMALLIVGVYALGTLSWLPAIYKTNTLAITGVIWLLLGMAATVGIGLIVFHEQLTLLQWLGIALAAIAITLLSL